MSNVLNESCEVLDGIIGQQTNDKVHIIFNESNYSDFTKYDKSKIFLVFTKLNETLYKYEMQHVCLQKYLRILGSRRLDCAGL